MTLEWVLQQIQTNQILQAGIGTVAFSSALYVVKGVPLAIYHSIKRFCTIEVTLNSKSGLYNDIVRELSGHRIKLIARLYSTDREGNVVAGYGPSLAWFGGRFISFNRQVIEKNLSLDEKTNITIFSRNVELMNRLIEAAKKPPAEHLIKVYAQGTGPYFHDSIDRQKRPLTSIFVNGGTIEEIVAKIEWFYANEKWYVERGINYKLIIMLYGPPGTGKTSIAFAMASHFGKNLCIMNAVFNLAETLTNAPDNSFALVEDIDMLTASREIKGNKIVADEVTDEIVTIDKIGEDFAKTSLHKLINTLDGVCTPHALIMFVTTNYIDRLDPALIRDSRVDLKKEIGLLELDAAARMFAAFYEIDPHMAPEVLKPYYKYNMTGAELQTIFMEEASQPGALSRLAKGPPPSSRSPRK